MAAVTIDVQTNRGDMKPAGATDFGYIRGGTWQKSNPSHVLSGCSTNTVMGRLRKLTGIEFDLPTDAQWEFACRASVGSPLYSGESWAETNVVKLGWCKVGATADSLKDVGQLMANTWGIYDLYGNVGEICLDIFNSYEIPADGSPVVDPVGAEAPPTWTVGQGYRSVRVVRGGSYQDAYSACASHKRAGCYSKTGYFPVTYGFRVMAPMGGKW